jgi:hypothetical protein
MHLAPKALGKRPIASTIEERAGGGECGGEAVVVSLSQAAAFAGLGRGGIEGTSMRESWAVGMNAA